jgi:hypothetical protein
MKLQHLVVLGEAASPPVAVVTGEAVAASHGEEQLTGPRYPAPELLPSPATGPPPRHFPHAGEAGGRIPTSVAGAGEESTYADVFQVATGRKWLGPQRRRQTGAVKKRLSGALKIAT